MSQMPQSKTSYLKDSERYLARIVGIFARTILIVFVIRFFIFEPTISDGTSMEPTLLDNELLFTEKLSALIVPPRRYNVVNLIDPADHNRMLIKRVIGLPGETVQIKGNRVVVSNPIDGSSLVLSEQYLRPDSVTLTQYGASSTFVLPSHTYFVLGDNRTYSRDSRDFGPVHRSLITGRVIMPFDWLR
ncbi:signal peptidase I [Candidatus Uhrbacteria bacterium]|nr:signal peptidase I [Candidatus Uhrbacteria bacterium]